MKYFLFSFYFLLLFSFSSQAQILVMETGAVSINHTTTSVSLTNTFSDPVVIARPSSFNGPHEVAIRLDNVSGTGFDIHLDEPVGRDGPHTMETIHYVVIEKGRYTFGDGTMLEAGTVSSSNLSFQTVNLLQTYPSTPAIFTQVQTDDGPTNFLKTRQRNSTVSSFQVKLEREESLNSTSPAGSEEIGYFAISKGGGVLDGLTIEANSYSVDEVAATQFFSESFSPGLHMIASIATYNGGDPSGLRWTNLTATQVELFVDEDISNDSEEGHVFETVDYFAIDDNGGAGIFLPVALPVEIVFFDVTLTRDEKVRVEWTTKSEVNNDFFTIEKSMDSKSWEKLGVVDGAGNSTNEIHYEHFDPFPYPGISYYRLSQTDFDGTREIVGVKSVELEVSHPYPNPTNGLVNIDLMGTENVEINVYNTLGQEIVDNIEFDASENNLITLDLSGLENGMYWIKVGQFVSRVEKH